MNCNSPVNTPAEQPVLQPTVQSRLTLGLPASACAGERRFPLTPEAVNMLVARGFTVKMEKGAASTIKYSDNRYTRQGATITSRDETLGCDVVLHIPQMPLHDVKKMRRGALLLTLSDISEYTDSAIRELLERGITSVAMIRIEDDNGSTPFNDVLAEVDGRASVAIASSFLADPLHGKGILLGGISGIVPCEITILGSDIAACAAARSALGLGATVRMFDNDVSRLRYALKELGTGVIASAVYPHVLQNALRSADVVIATEAGSGCVIGQDMTELMKKHVILLDLCQISGRIFPSIPAASLTEVTHSGTSCHTAARRCFTHVGNAVPRTSAMALSNVLITMLDRILSCDGITNALKIMPGLRPAVQTFMGKAVSTALARKLNMRQVDINIFLSLS